MGERLPRPSDAPSGRRCLERSCACESELRDLAALGLTAAAVAHEMNNVLGYLLLNLEAAQRAHHAKQAPRAHDAERPIAEALAGARRLAEIAADLRFASPSAGPAAEARDVGRAVRLAVRMASHHTCDVATVHVDAPSVRLFVAADARIEQVVLNLILNAAEAMDASSPTENHIRIRVGTDGGNVCIEVEDNGRGIDVDVLPLIFEPFFTTKAERRGTGVGLFVCRQIANLAGGSLTVARTTRAGTTFRALFPMAQP